MEGEDPTSDPYMSTGIAGGSTVGAGGGGAMVGGGAGEEGRGTVPCPPEALGNDTAMRLESEASAAALLLQTEQRKNEEDTEALNTKVSEDSEHHKQAMSESNMQPGLKP